MRLVRAASNFSGLLLASLFLSTPLTAAVLLVGGQEGTEDDPNTTEGAESEEDWNPIVTCTVPNGGTIEDLLVCLQNEIAIPPPPCPPELETASPGGGKLVRRNPGNALCSDPDSRQEFIVTRVPPPHYGVEIRRLDGSEIERIALRENDPGIQTTELHNDRPFRVARVRQIEETPEGGQVHLVIDDIAVTLSFAHGQLPTLPEINADAVRALRAGGLTITYQAPYFYISNHTRLPRGVHVVHFRSTDPGITRSDLALLPEDEAPTPMAQP